MMRSVAPRSFLARAREVFDGLWNYGNEEYRMVRDLKDDIRKDTERIRKLTADTKAELNGRLPSALSDLNAELSRYKQHVEPNDKVLEELRSKLGPLPTSHLTPEAIARSLEDLAKSSSNVSVTELAAHLRSLGQGKTAPRSADNEAKRHD